MNKNSDNTTTSSNVPAQTTNAVTFANPPLVNSDTQYSERPSYSGSQANKQQYQGG
jgi:hypothetical protein